MAPLDWALGKLTADPPLPEQVLRYLEPGPQSAITPPVDLVASQIQGETRRQRLIAAVVYVWSYFIYDNRFSDEAFTRTADELFFSRRLGGCSDFALAQAALFRAVGIPARMVVTANVKWMREVVENPLLMPNGHVFIEAYLEDRWVLVDSTYRLLFRDYRPENPSYPRGEFFYKRCQDFWEAGIYQVDDVDTLFHAFALAFDARRYEDVDYPSVGI